MSCDGLRVSVLSEYLSTVTDNHIFYFIANSVSYKLTAGALKAYVKTALDSDEVANASGVTGATVSAALDALASAISTHVSDTANPHSTDLGNLGSGTLVQLNALVTDANLDDASSPRTPTAHAASHSDGGSDEITVENLATAGTTDQVLKSDGAGGLVMGEVSSDEVPSDSTEFAETDLTAIVDRLDQQDGALGAAIGGINKWLDEDLKEGVVLVDNTIGTPTEGTTVASVLMHSLSSMWVSGFALTENVDGTVDVADGVIRLRSSDSIDAPFYTAAVTGVVDQALTDNTTNYICATYNAGSPVLSVSTDITASNIRDNVCMWAVTRVGTDLHHVDFREVSTDAASGYTKRTTAPGLHAYGSGAILEGTGTRNVGLSAGRFYIGASGQDTSAFDTSVADTYTLIYQDGASGWTRTASQTQISNTEYDDGSGTLATLSNNAYGIWFVYIVRNSPDELFIMPGRSDYSKLVEAQAALVPSSLPPEFDPYGCGILVGKIIILKSATSFADVQTPFLTLLASATPTNHADLTGTTDADSHPGTAITHDPSATWLTAISSQAAIAELAVALQPAIGGIHSHNGAVAQSIPTGTTYTKITAFTDNEPSLNVTSDAANDKITITKTGLYAVNGAMSFSSGTVNTIWWGTVFLDGVEQDNVHWKKAVATTGDVGSASFTGIIDVTTVPVDLDFRVRHDKGSAVDLTVEYSNLNVDRRAPT